MTLAVLRASFSNGGIVVGFTLDDLAGEQVDRFAGAKGVTDIAAFRKALDRAEAWSFTTRPLDLAETVEFWLANDRVGSSASI
jgi:hypothetical protein